MRTTLNLPDALMERLRAHARESGRTVTSVVEEALHDALERRHDVAEPVDFPVLGRPGGTPLVDLADAHHLQDLMDGADAGSIDRLLSEVRAGHLGDASQGRDDRSPDDGGSDEVRPDEMRPDDGDDPAR